MKLDITLLGGGQTITYEQGFITNEDNQIIGKIKNISFEPFVQEGIKLVNELDSKKDSSITYIHNILKILTELIEWNL